LSDDTGQFIKNPEALLEEGIGQADLVGSNLCTMVGNGKNNPAILLDFGRKYTGDWRLSPACSRTMILLKSG
jgi:hypothetical protein